MNELLTMEEILRKQGFLVRPISGISMLPMLEEKKDAVRLVHVNGRLKKYDLPLYRRKNGDLVLHRIIKVKKDHYVTCGDNSLELENVYFDQIIAVAEGYFKDGKYIPCDDETYLTYVRRHCKHFHSREIIRPVRVPVEWGTLARLLRMALTGNIERIDIPQSFNWKRLFAIAKNQMIAATLYPAVRAQDCPEDVLAEWKARYDQNLRKQILFDAERGAILGLMEKNGIKYMPLKGVFIKDCYLRVGMREFADNDILYDERFADKLREIMSERGYQTESFGGVHDTYLKEPVYNFEMHRRLFGNEMKKHFSDVWSRAVKDVGNEFGYHLTDEDLYLHVLAHFHKHYSGGGAGLRSFADVWLLRKKRFAGGYDGEYVTKKVEECGLREFEDFVLRTADALFEGDVSEISDETVAYLLDSGAYGLSTHQIENGLQKNGKIKYLAKRLFLPYSTMKVAYPVLRYLPILLPVFWVTRVVSAFLFKSKRQRMMHEMKTVRHARNQK